MPPTTKKTESEYRAHATAECAREPLPWFLVFEFFPPKLWAEFLVLSFVSFFGF